MLREIGEVIGVDSAVGSLHLDGEQGYDKVAAGNHVGVEKGIDGVGGLSLSKVHAER